MSDLRELEQKATPGPWEYDDTTDQHYDDDGTVTPTGWFRGAVGNVDVGDYNTLSLADAALIAALRNAAPLLLDVVDAVRALVPGWETDSMGYYDFDKQAVVDALTALDQHLGEAK